MLCCDRKLLAGFSLAVSAFLFACAPRATYRPAATAPSPPAPPTVAVPPPAKAVTPAVEERPTPLLTESEIYEQDIRRRNSSPTPEESPPPKIDLPEAEGLGSADASIPQPAKVGEGFAPVEPPVDREARLEGSKGRKPEVMTAHPVETPLLAMITPETPPRSALSLRLAEEGRKLLEQREYRKGLNQLERAISLDSRNRYAYYYLAEAHYALAHYRQSLNFLEITQPHFAAEPQWLAQVVALRGRNYESLGFFERADENYLEALALDPQNRVALEGITRIESKPPVSAR